MDELKVTKDLREEVLKHCDSFDYCGRNLAFFSSKNKRNITLAIAAVLKANPVFVVSIMDTTKGDDSKLETTVQFTQVGFTGG